MRIEDGKPVYDNDHERLIALGAIVEEVFDRPVGFMLIVHDALSGQPPISIDNFQGSEGVLMLLRTVLDHYIQARKTAFTTKETKTDDTVRPSRPASTEGNTDG